jgi:hypothetical protein
MFGPEIETQRRTLHDALADLPTEEIRLDKRATKSAISQISGILLDDLGDLGATLLDDLVPIDLAMPSDRKPTLNERKTPPKPLIVTPVPPSKSLTYVSPSTSAPTIPVLDASSSKSIEIEPPKPDRTTWIVLAIVAAVVLMLSVVAIVIVSSWRAGEIPTITPGPRATVPVDAQQPAEPPQVAPPPDAAHAPADALPATVDAAAPVTPPSHPARRRPTK